MGGPFAVLCPAPKAAFRVTCGALSWFRSSEVARRGFCRDCGAPIAFDYSEDDGIGLLVGTFDRPDPIPPVVQYGVESRLPWYAHLPQLPGDQAAYAEDDP